MKNEITKTSVAIERARNIIDQAMPRQQNLFLPDLDNAEVAPLYALAHWGIEIGLKSILLLQDDQYRPKDDRHDLRKSFQRLKERNSEDASYLIKAFNDSICFYTIDKFQWQQFKSLDVYLGKYGGGDLYETFRYWALPQGELYHIPLFVHRELLLALEYLHGWRHQRVTSIRVEEWVRRKLSEEVQGHLQTCHSCRNTLPKPLLEILRDAAPTDTPFRETLLSLYNRHVKMADNQCVNRVIRGAIETLRGDRDPAVRYLIITLDDLPEGSLEKPGDIELEVRWKAQDISGVVQLMSGQELGSIQQLIDSRWLVRAYLPPTISKFAKTRSDAINWLANTYTEIVELSVDGSEWRMERGISPVHFGRYQSESGVWTPNEIRFVHNTHGLSVGQHIVVRIKREFLYEKAEGNIFKVEGNLVEFGE